MSDPRHDRAEDQSTRPNDTVNDGGNGPSQGPGSEADEQDLAETNPGRHGRPSDDADEGHS